MDVRNECEVIQIFLKISIKKILLFINLRSINGEIVHKRNNQIETRPG